jgi:excisionase family DNA binding protein
MVDQKYYTIQEAAKVLACDDETILAQIHSGELPAVNIARRLQSKRPTWRIAEGELGRWLLKRVSVHGHLAGVLGSGVDSGWASP